jgi:hypothetical protein
MLGDAFASRWAERLTAALQEIALGRVLGAGDPRLVRQRCLSGAAQASEQVGTDSVEQVVATEPLAGQASTRVSAAAGPSTSATTTARLRATTGLGASARNWLYSCRICPQSVPAGAGASLWTALIAAWIWYGPG